MECTRRIERLLNGQNDISGGYSGIRLFGVSPLFLSRKALERSQRSSGK
jgi:hypothetical protein